VRLYSFRIAVENFMLDIELKYEYIPSTLWSKWAQWKHPDKKISESEICNILSGV
jgi:hypothetical protein